MTYLIENTYRPELLDVLEEWVLTRRPADAFTLLQLIARRRRELVSAN